MTGGYEDKHILARLPKGFAIFTLVRDYSPGWAIVFHENAVHHIFFVIGTKGTMDSLTPHLIEITRIDCVKKLFASLPSVLV